MEQNISSMKPSIIDLIRDIKSDRSKMERYVRYINNFNKEWESGGYGSSNPEEGKYLWGQKISIKPELKSLMLLMIWSTHLFTITLNPTI